MVCEADFETRNPQEFVRAVPDGKPLPWSRPPPEDIELVIDYLNPNDFCTAMGRLANAGIGTAGCMTAGNHNTGI